MSETYTQNSDELEKIDLMEGLFKGIKVLKKTWWIGLILVMLGCGTSIGYQKLFYVPEYTASANFTVTLGSTSSVSSYLAGISLKQMTESFPYILESGALQDVVCRDLGVSSLDAKITASVLEDTSLFEMRVTASDPEMAYNILSSLIEHYPSVAEYIIGSTNLTMLDNSGVPANPSNGTSVKRQGEKGILGGLALYLVILVIFVIARRTVAAESDLKKYTSLPCLASIPKLTMKKRSGNKQKLMLVNQRSLSPAFIEAVNTLRIRVVRALGKSKHKVILLSSTNEGEGKTTVTVNLALSLSQKDARVLLIDADLRHPSICNALGVENEQGLCSVLQGTAGLSETIFRYENSNLDVIAGMEKINNAKIPGLLLSERMEEILKVCREGYDYVFIDTPPCGVIQDASLLANKCDASLMIIRQDYVPRDKILAAMEMLSDTGTRILGYCINSEDTGIGSYGYGRYGYGKYGYSSKGYKKYGYDEKKQ